MSWLLNVIYAGLLILASPWLLVAAWRKRKYREGWNAKFLGGVTARKGQRPCIWFHAVSLGEVNLLGVLLEEMARRRPDVDCYLTTTTRTGFQAARQRYPRVTVSYCPLDFSWATRRAMARIRPDLLVLAELELWPNLILAARRHGARVALVNGRLSPRSYRGYRRLGPWIGWLLRKVDLLIVQTPQYADRFAALGALSERIYVSGSLKFDGAATQRNHPASRQLARMAQIDRQQVIWVAGSTFPPEEEMLMDVFQRLQADYPMLRLLLVPRHPERFEEVAQILRRTGQSFTRRSQLDLPPGERSSSSTAPVLLVDSVGELAAWWALAHIGFVGGSFGSRGGQNMIEPAGLGVPLCFGPQTENFRDVVQQMIQAEAAEVVHDARELERFVRWCLDSPEQARRQGERARLLVLQNQGAAGRTADQLLSLLDRRAQVPTGRPSLDDSGLRKAI
jgi:3-deoxy-D-manno-octulosonic-acid transferase